MVLTKGISDFTTKKFSLLAWPGPAVVHDSVICSGLVSEDTKLSINSSFDRCFDDIAISHSTFRLTARVKTIVTSAKRILSYTFSPTPAFRLPILNENSMTLSLCTVTIHMLSHLHGRYGSCGAVIFRIPPHLLLKCNSEQLCFPNSAFTPTGI